LPECRGAAEDEQQQDLSEHPLYDGRSRQLGIASAFWPGARIYKYNLRAAPRFLRPAIDWCYLRQMPASRLPDRLMTTAARFIDAFRLDYGALDVLLDDRGDFLRG
jgi:hypothetical protein